MRGENEMARYTINVKGVESEVVIHACNGCGTEITEEHDEETYSNGDKELHFHSTCEQELRTTSGPQSNNKGETALQVQTRMKELQTRVKEQATPFVTASKLLGTFVFLPVTFVWLDDYLYEFATSHENSNPDAITDLLVCLGLGWLLVAFLFGAIIVEGGSL